MKMSALLLSWVAMAFSASVFSHANIQPKDILDDFAGRQYEEGSRAVIGMIVGHGCRNMKHPDRARLPTKGLSILFPDPTAYPGIFQPGHFGVKPRLSANWRKTKSVKGSLAQPVESHGSTVSVDARAIYWLKGKLRDDQYDNFEARMGIPKLAEGAFSCAQVYVPTVQYCHKRHALAWIGAETENFPADSDDKIVVYGFPRDAVPEGEGRAFAPSFYVKRTGSNVDCNEVCNSRSPDYDPAQCPEVRPDPKEIDEFLNTKARLP
ncbi:MAG: DUF1775 domain-containing protein [Methylococcales bacterium]